MSSISTTLYFFSLQNLNLYAQIIDLWPWKFKITKNISLSFFLFLHFEKFKVCSIFQANKTIFWLSPLISLFSSFFPFPKLYFPVPLLVSKIHSLYNLKYKDHIKIIVLFVERKRVLFYIYFKSKYQII